MGMTLPSRAGGPTTQEVGFIELDFSHVAHWLVEVLAPGWSIVKPTWLTMKDAIHDLAPMSILNRYACIGLGAWSLLLSNGPMGTDVGLLPSHAARRLGCRGIRAVRVDDDEPGYPARILEVYGPGGEPSGRLERSIAAMNDGGRWIFESSGRVFAFEDTAAYAKRDKRSRLTGAMLTDYLRALGVPIDLEPNWRTGLLIQNPMLRDRSHLM